MKTKSKKSKAAVRNARSDRARRALPNHILGRALIQAYVETGKRFTPGMRRVLRID